MSFQQVLLIGNVGQDAELTKVGDTHVAKFSVATKEVWKDKNGEKKEATEWHRIELWGRQAEAIAKWIEKGREVCVVGKINTHTYQKDGVSKEAKVIRANDVKFVGGSGKKSGSGEEGQGRSRGSRRDLADEADPGMFQDDDIPFN